jgi:MFS family permease
MGDLPATAAAVPDAETPRRTQWTVISILFVFYAVAYLDKRLITFLIEPIRASFGASDFQMSLVTGTAFVLFYVLFSIPIGWAVDRFSRRNIIFLGVIAWSLFATMGGFTRNLWQLLLTRCGVGAGEAVLGPAGNSLVADVVPRHRLTRATAATHAGALAGSALAFGLGGLLLSFASAGDFDLPLLGRTEAWQLVMIVTGVPGLLLAFLVFAMREPVRRGRIRETAGQGEARGSAFRYMMRNRGFYLRHFLGFSLISIASAGFAGWMPTHMMRNYDLPVASLGGILAGLQLSFGVIGMFLPAIIIDHVFKRGRGDAHLHIFGWAALIMGVAGILVGIAPNAALAFCGIAIVDMMVGFLPVAGAALQLSTPNEYRGQITAMFLVVYNVIGQGLGPIIVATVTDYGFGDDKMVGWSLALTFAIVTPLGAFFLLSGRTAMRRCVESFGTGETDARG